MAPAPYSFSLLQGESLAKQFTIKDASTTPPTVINTTGWTGRARCTDPTTGEVLFDMTTENGGLTNGGADGTFYMNPVFIDTFSFAPKGYSFTFYARNAGNVNRAYLAGTLTIEAGQPSYP